MKNSSDFSIRQKVTILVAMLVELVAPNIQPFERLPFVSKTRGNVFQRLKGKITAEEHDSYIKSANTIRATNEWCEKV